MRMELSGGMHAVCVTYEAGAIQFEEFPKTKEPAWILGVGYNTVSDRQELQNDISSRLWFTYRKNFTPIGGTGPMSDQGWGCMLRCGQMMLGQALVCRHLGRDWRWNPAAYDNDYTKILQLFLDKKDSCYSIHQIAQMGVSEGKSVGQWFGPNTVAQVLKKLALFEDWSSLAIHVAMDNTVIIDDIIGGMSKSSTPLGKLGSSGPTGGPYSMCLNQYIQERYVYYMYMYSKQLIEHTLQRQACTRFCSIHQATVTES